MFYCGMTRLRNTSLGVFIQCQYTRTILRNKDMGQSLFKKHSKFQNFDEIFSCGMTRLRNSNLDFFYTNVAWPDSGIRMWMFLYDVNTKEPFYETKILGRVCLRNIQNSKNLIRYRTVEWPDLGTFLDNIKTQELF